MNNDHENELESQELEDRDLLQEQETLVEPKAGELDDILSEQIKTAYHQQTSKFAVSDVARIACEHSPIDLAYAAIKLPSLLRPILYENLSDIESKALFMINTDSNTRCAVFRHISDKETKELIEHMPPDEAVAVLDDISERRFRRVIEIIDAQKATRIKEIKKHERNTAGRLMTNEFFAFNMEATIGEAANFIRENPGIDLTRQVFILNSAGELQGWIPARNLIINPHDLPLRKVMRPILHKVLPDSTREEIVDIVERYKIASLPVVDRDDHLLGLVASEDVMDAIQDMADETIAQMAGTGEKVGENEPMSKRLLARAPWLIVTLLAGLVNGVLMSSLDSYNAGSLTFVLFFVPLITGMSGNIGIQCSTVLVRSMATGAISPATRKDAIMKEIFIGMSSGIMFGVVCGIAVSFLNFLGLSHPNITPFFVGCIVGVGLLGACVSGTLLGVFSPLFFVRMGVDPAIASGPIVTAFNDILSMSIYFLIAMGLTAFFIG